MGSTYVRTESDNKNVLYYRTFQNDKFILKNVSNRFCTDVGYALIYDAKKSDRVCIIKMLKMEKKVKK